MSEIASVFISTRLDLSGFNRDLEALKRVNTPTVNIKANADMSGVTGEFARVARQASDSGKATGASFGSGMVYSARGFGKTAGETAGKSYGEGLKSQRSFIDGIVQGIGQSVGNGLMGAARMGISAMGGLATKILDAGVASEKSTVAFTVFLGSAEKAQQVLKDVTEFAANTPFELPEVKSAAQSLLAFGVEADKLKPTLTSIGDIASGVGIPFNELAQIFGKAKTQGRLFQEDINQLTGRGIPIIAELAKQFGVTEGEVKKLVSSGEVGFGNLEKAFASMTGEGGRFEGLMEKMSRTTGGRLTNLADSMTTAFVKIFETLSPVINATLDLVVKFLGNIKVNFEGVNDLAKQFGGILSANSGKAAELGTTISTGLSESMKQVTAIAKQFNAYLEKNPEVVELLTDLFKGLSLVVKTMGDRMREGVGHLTSMAEKFGGILSTVSKIYVTIKNFIASLSGFKPPAWLTGVLGGMGGGWMDGQMGGASMDAGKYSIADPFDSSVTSYSDASPHHSYQQTSRGTVKDMTISKDGNVNVPVPSAMSGTVKSAGWLGGYGNAVVVMSPTGEQALLAHMKQGSLAVKAGDQVVKGQQLGIQGSTGNSTGTHVHIEAPEKVVKGYYDSLLSGNWGGGSNTAGATSMVGAFLKALRDGEQSGSYRVDPKGNSMGARGAYQFIPGTRKGILNATGLDAWSPDPATQDKAAIALIKQVNPRAYTMIESGDLAGAARLLNRTWTSLPGGAEQSPIWRGKSIDSYRPRVVAGRGGEEMSDIFQVFNGKLGGLPTGAFGLSSARPMAGMTANKGFGSYSVESIVNSRKDNYDNWIGGERTKSDFQQGYDDAKIENARKALESFLDTQREQLAITKQFSDAFQQAYEEAPERFRSIAAESSIASMNLEDLTKSADYLKEFSLEPINEQAQELGKTLVDTVGGGFKSAIGDMVKGTKSLGSVVLDLIGNLASSLADMALNNIFGSADSGTGILGSIFGGLFGGGGGMKFSGSTVPFFDIPMLADGGVVTRPTLAMIGESGAEKVTPLRLAGAADGNKGVNVNIELTVQNKGSGQMDSEQSKDLQKAVDRAVQAGINKALRPGGQLNR